jgi:epoxyqueuosine reductase
MDAEAVSRGLIDAARRLGFHRVGVVAVAPAERHAVFEAWVAAGCAGSMDYLVSPEARAQRRDVRALLTEARSVVTVGLAYAAPAAPAPPGTGVIARYARGADYHMVLKDKLTRLGEAAAALLGRPVAARPCVDTAHVLERDLADRGGLGFAGKNTMIIAPGLGSYLLLGELLLDVDAAPVGGAERRRCGECRLCLDACPTGAFVAAHALDARRCISYLTIEHRGAIPRELRAAIGQRIFGCDVCQEVCPFNAAASACAPELAPTRDPPDLVALLSLGAAQFRRFVRRTALRRIHRAQLLRNVCVALGNGADRGAIGPLRQAFLVEGPLVRVHAAWALGRLGDHAFLSGRLADEPDAEVREEINLTLACAGGL